MVFFKFEELFSSEAADKTNYWKMHVLKIGESRPHHKPQSVPDPLPVYTTEPSSGCVGRWAPGKCLGLSNELSLVTPPLPVHKHRSGGGGGGVVRAESGGSHRRSLSVDGGEWLAAISAREEAQ